MENSKKRTRTKAEILLDAKLIFDLSNKGYNFFEIQEEIKKRRGYSLSFSQISISLKKVYEKITANADKDIERIKHQQLKKIELIQKIALQDYELSKQRKVKPKKGTLNDDSDTQTVLSYGNKGFLDVVLNCVEMQNKLYGLNTTKIESTGINLVWNEELTPPTNET
jgi:rRNA-processing protein FCF1